MKRQKKVETILHIMNEHPRPVFTSYWAAELYKRPALTPLGRYILERLFEKREWEGKSGGRSGYRLFHATKPSIQLRGAENNLARIAWAGDLPSSKKRKYSTMLVEFEDDRHYFGRDGGRQRGADVHKELQDFVKYSYDRYQVLHPKADPLTTAVLQCINSVGFTLIDAEKVVSDLQSRSGTAIDLLGMNAAGELAVFETKTGYANSNFSEIDPNKTKNMQSPFANIKDTPLNRARMQLLYGSLLLETSYGLVPAHHYVIHASPDTNTARLHPIGPDVLKHRYTLLSAVRYHRQLEDNQKKQKKIRRSAPKSIVIKLT